MKKIVLTLTSLLLASCVSKEGLTQNSARTPKGNVNSSIVVEEFADLQCPACRGAHTQIVKPLMEKHGKNIRFEFKHFPLRQIHPFAQEAAEAAECAADQGKFWEFVDDTYEEQEKLTRTNLIERAEKIGIMDVNHFERCIKSRIKRDAVQADFLDGTKRGVNGTPTFFISGVKAPKNTLESITEIIDTKVRSQKL